MSLNAKSLNTKLPVEMKQMVLSFVDYEKPLREFKKNLSAELDDYFVLRKPGVLHMFVNVLQCALPLYKNNLRTYTGIEECVEKYGEHYCEFKQNLEILQVRLWEERVFVRLQTSVNGRKFEFELRECMEITFLQLEWTDLDTYLDMTDYVDIYSLPFCVITGKTMFWLDTEILLQIHTDFWWNINLTYEIMKNTERIF